MSKIFLLTRPQHDHRVSYLYSWSEEILNFARNKNISFTDFKRNEANKTNVESYLKKKNPEMIIFNGHGTDTAILGHKDEPLIELDKNDNLLKDKIIYALACYSANNLGSNIIEKGGKCFLGYSKPFAWVHSSDRTCNPATDRISFPFKEISNAIPLALLSGHTTNESNEKAKRIGEKLIEKYSVSTDDETKKDIRFWLFWDINCQEILGDKDAAF
ncbi:hypothetical protein HYZ41_04615 [archaeon]|nr:hypothetical protein [archaeon]